MAVLTTSSIPTVPPARLGKLLAQRRRDLGMSIEELAASSDGALSSEDLRLAEQGCRALEDAFVATITNLYECSSGPVIPDRYQLVVDLGREQLTAGPDALDLPDTEPAEVLERYLAFVYLMRNQNPGTKVSLRREDIEVLAVALNTPADRIERRLTLLMMSKQVRQRTYSIRKQVAVSAIGLLVGFTSMGALVLTPEESTTLPDQSAVTQSHTQARPTGGRPQQLVSPPPARPDTVEEPLPLGDST